VDGFILFCVGKGIWLLGKSRRVQVFPGMWAPQSTAPLAARAAASLCVGSGALSLCCFVFPWLSMGGGSVNSPPLLPEWFGAMVLKNQPWCAQELRSSCQSPKYFQRSHCFPKSRFSSRYPLVNTGNDGHCPCGQGCDPHSLT
jgi:hypothetical protein